MTYIKRLIQILLFVYLLIVVLLTFTQVVFRNFGISISGYDEIIGIAAIWSYFLGMAHTTLTDSHIKGGLDELIKNETVKNILGNISNLGLLIFSMIALMASIDIFITAFTHDYRSLYFNIPITLSASALVVGFGLNILFIVARRIYKK
ncbi:TRAP transporter small permease subunit [Alcaligenaceae bacterium]|nr:TRAP transporter small permease subunit [Alcaligenaceae bacterium]